MPTSDLFPSDQAPKPISKELPKRQAEPAFSALGLGERLTKAVDRAGFTEPTPIQKRAIPALLKGRDLVGQAQTGSGKTAAYLLPALENIQQEAGLQVLVLVPTRELAEQVLQDVRTLGAFSNIKAVSVIGGQRYDRQIDLIRKGAHVVVATPGRLLDHLDSGVFKKFNPSYVVLDEADEMLDMGFLEDVHKIFKFLPEKRQTALFSATFPKPIEKLAKEQLKQPEWVRLLPKGDLQSHIEQRLYVVSESEREATILRVIDFEQPTKAVVFCRRRMDTEVLAESLQKRGLRIRAIHGDLQQRVRHQALKEIKQGQIQILLATDVASRGLDISDLTHVFNYHVPDNVDRFTHRIGRTGRAGKKGIAITLATPDEVARHPFFREYPVKKFSLQAVPRRKDIEGRVHRDLIQKIQDAPLSVKAKSFVEKLEPEEMKEVILRMFSLMEVPGASKSAGPDELGFKPDQVLSMGQRRPTKRGGFTRGGRKPFTKKGSGKPFRLKKKKW